MINRYELVGNYQEGIELESSEDGDLMYHDDHIKALDALTAERDKYKPFHDAVIDMAVVNWTYDGKTERDAHDAIKKLVHCYCIERSDPALNEALAKLTERAESAERKLAAVLDGLRKLRGEKPCQCAPRYSVCRCEQNVDTYTLARYEAHDDAVDVAVEIAEGEG